MLQSQHLGLLLSSTFQHGMQPADNGPFKVLKGAYRKHLERLQSLSDAAPVGKINFVRCLLRARKEVTPTVIKSAFRHTGIWPISRRKAHSHPEIQKDPEKRIPSDQPVEPVAVTRRQILDLAKEGITTATRRFELKKVADNLDEKNAEIAILKRQLAEFHEKKALEAEKTTRRKPVKKPNPNARFIKGSEIWSTNSTIQSLNAELRARKKGPKKNLLWWLRRKLWLWNQQMMMRKMSQFNRHFQGAAVRSALRSE